MDKEALNLEVWNSMRADLWGSTGIVELGAHLAFAVENDMKHILFSFSRYKFISKMIEAPIKKKVLELGCNEGFFSMLLAKQAASFVGVDADSEAINWANSKHRKENMNFISDNFLGKTYGEFDAVLSLDVIEHIDKEIEDKFLQTICDNLNDTGFAIVGTPNISAAQYASEPSRIAHVNLYSQERLQALFLKKFNNVFMFGMNDEVLHTGFGPMCHYILALACGKKEVINK